MCDWAQTRVVVIGTSMFVCGYILQILAEILRKMYKNHDHYNNDSDRF